MNSHNPANFPHGFRRPLSGGEDRLAAIRPPVRVVASDTLFHGEHEIGIDHRGSLYRLKITRQGKLILNK